MTDDVPGGGQLRAALGEQTPLLTEAPTSEVLAVRVHRVLGAAADLLDLAADREDSRPAAVPAPGRCDPPRTCGTRREAPRSVRSRPARVRVRIDEDDRVLLGGWTRIVLRRHHA